MVTASLDTRPVERQVPYVGMVDASFSGDSFAMTFATKGISQRELEGNAVEHNRKHLHT